MKMRVTHIPRMTQNMRAKLDPKLMGSIRDHIDYSFMVTNRKIFRFSLKDLAEYKKYGNGNRIIQDAND